MNRLGQIISILAMGALTACTAELPSEPVPTAPPPGSTSGGTDTTFDHDNNGISPWDLIQRIEEEGPPRFTSHMHSFPKIHYRTLGSVLTSLGINAANATQLSAGELYTDGFNALGGPNFANRIRENSSVTTSGASREFDIFAAGADEIIAALPTLARCQVGGVGVQLFDANNQCRADGITCLVGVPATATHLDICNLSVTQATTPEVGKKLAVAALLAAAYTCE